MEENISLKKKTKYFFSYISEVLKNICDKSAITGDAKNQLISSLIMFTLPFSRFE